MSLSGVYESVDLTTRDAVNALRRGPSAGGVDESDTYVDALIARESARITQYLSRHTLKAARTEIYTLRKGRKVLRLDGYPIEMPAIGDASFPSAASADSLATLATQTQTELSAVDPALDFGMGVLRFSNSVSSLRYVQITYTGGLMKAHGCPEDDLPGWLFHAATMQCVYAVQRGQSLGGSIEKVAGVGMTIEREYGLLKTVREELDAHRRGE